MQPDIQWLDDPRVFRVNRLDAHSDHAFYAGEADYAAGQSALRQSLDGVWKFAYSVCASARPADFYREGYDLSGFDEIRVPGHIELAGYDKIQYINVLYPWEGFAYRRPAFCGIPGGQEGQFSAAAYNPVGSYVRTFDLDASLRGKRVVIRFEGVEQAMYVWLNGRFIGYAEDSFTPSEFDLTDALRDTGNVLAVEVHKRSTAAYLEDQDFFRFFGIFRSVSLLALPQAHVEDLWLRPSLDLETDAAEVRLDLRVSGQASGRLAVAILDGEETLLTREAALAPNMAMTLAMPGPVKRWDHRRAYLYRLELRLYNEAGQLVEIVPQRFGLRRLELRDGVIYLNGKRLILNGVNRHEWNAHSGRCISEQDERYDVACMKRNHINAVRTCHYPDRLSFYALCDEQGIYMMAETNLESHGSWWQKLPGEEPTWNVPGSLPEWEGAALDRAQSNFEFLKNHTAILFWSLGNESYAGDVLAKMNDYYKQRDPDRIVHYEGVFQNRAYDDRISDVESRMYATPQECEDYLAHRPKKPYMLCEYMHDMGNSMGGMDSYIKLIERYPQYHGGFIWDFIDQALFVRDEVTGREVLRYGGDFDDRLSDYEFSANGIVFADRTEKPAMQEVRYYYGLYD